MINKELLHFLPSAQLKQPLQNFLSSRCTSSLAALSIGTQLSHPPDLSVMNFIPTPADVIMARKCASVILSRKNTCVLTTAKHNKISYPKGVPF